MTEITKDQVAQGERQINEILTMIDRHCSRNDTDVNVLISAMIAMIGRIVAASAAEDSDHQERLIEFVGKSIRVSLAENGYRKFTDDMADAIPPWEKN